MGFVLYTQHKPILNMAFAQVDKEALAEADLEADLDPVIHEAYCRFVSAYELPEYKTKTMHPKALSDLADTFGQGLPRFVLGMLSATEVTQINKEVKRRARVSG